MKLPFTKMSGAGNDFVVLDNRDRHLHLTTDQIALLCHRRFGIGADGLLAVEPGENGADYRMRYYNADGGEAEMCGNGARCFARYVSRWDEKKERVSFLTPAGTIGAQYVGGDVRINMTPPTDLKLRLTPVLTTGLVEMHSINTGVPHAVILLEDVENAPVVALGREVRHHEAFAPRGTNVNFAEVLDDQSIRVRTYERGVEDETLACGTGVTAAAIIAHVARGVALPVRVKVQSGDWLQVDFQHQDHAFSNVTLQGPADVVFDGEIDLKK